jgi:hypothetical protein
MNRLHQIANITKAVVDKTVNTIDVICASDHDAAEFVELVCSQDDSAANSIHNELLILMSNMGWQFDHTEYSNFEFLIELKNFLKKYKNGLKFEIVLQHNGRYSANCKNEVTNDLQSLIQAAKYNYEKV